MKTFLYSSLFLMIITQIRAQPSVIFAGGEGQGFACIENTISDNYITDGGNGQGYSIQHISLEENTYLSSGGNGSGYTASVNSTQSYFLSKGGSGEGHDTDENKEAFVWTGAVGTGWNVNGNWNYNVVPDINRPVIIPSGVPNYPALNAGTFAIGQNPNNGSFTCESLLIMQDAIVTTRINNQVENYNTIQIDGELRVKRTEINAIRNIQNGVIIISNSGFLNIRP